MPNDLNQYVLDEAQPNVSKNILSFNGIRSQYLDVDKILLCAKDKKRTTALLRTIGFRMPIELNGSGLNRSVSYVCAMSQDNGK